MGGLGSVYEDVVVCFAIMSIYADQLGFTGYVLQKSTISLFTGGLTASEGLLGMFITCFKRGFTLTRL